MRKRKPRFHKWDEPYNKNAKCIYCGMIRQGFYPKTLYWLNGKILASEFAPPCEKNPLNAQTEIDLL